MSEVILLLADLVSCGLTQHALLCVVVLQTMYRKSLTGQRARCKAFSVRLVLFQGFFVRSQAFFVCIFCFTPNARNMHVHPDSFNPSRHNKK